MALDLNEALRVDDFSTETLLEVTERLEQSITGRQFILREAELDDLWRYAEAALQIAQNMQDERSSKSLERLLAFVMEAHDLAGEGTHLEAAKRLRLAMVPADPH